MEEFKEVNKSFSILRFYKSVKNLDHKDRFRDYDEWLNSNKTIQYKEQLNQALSLLKITQHYTMKVGVGKRWYRTGRFTINIQIDTEVI